MTTALFACAGCHTPSPRPGHRCPSPPAGRVIPGQRIRAARDYLAARTELLDRLPCPERVLLALGALVAGVGSIDCVDLLAALTEPDTVELALALLDEIGVPCA